MACQIIFDRPAVGCAAPEHHDRLPVLGDDGAGVARRADQRDGDDALLHPHTHKDGKRRAAQGGGRVQPQAARKIVNECEHCQHTQDKQRVARGQQQPRPGQRGTEKHDAAQKF